MKIRLLPHCSLLRGVPAAEAQDQTDSTVIRAGRNIAMTTGISCHLVSPD